MNPNTLNPLFVSLKLAVLVSICLLLICLPLARLRLACRSRLLLLLDSIVCLPLVLPPSVLGFYFLVLLSPGSVFGRFIEKSFNIRFLFTFPGLVCATMFICFPLMYQNLRNAMQAVDPDLYAASYSLGKGRIVTFMCVLLPNIVPGILTALIVCFSRVLGEFGLALMIGGSIPGKTKTISIAIYEFAELGLYGEAGSWSAALLLVAWLLSLPLTLLQYKKNTHL